MSTTGILYLHGFRSSPASWKSRLLNETLSARGQSDNFFCPALSHIPDEAITQAETIIHSHQGPLTLVGSSLGGFYATTLAEKHDLRAVLINPAVLAPISLNKYIGRQTNLHSAEEFEFTATHIEQLHALEVSEITPERYFLLLETGDEVLDYREAVRRYAGSRQTVLEGGDHSFTRFPDLLPQLLEYCGL
jgi:predicted esterase YcpF (UPF0227 family)